MQQALEFELVTFHFFGGLVIWVVLLAGGEEEGYHADRDERNIVVIAAKRKGEYKQHKDISLCVCVFILSNVQSDRFIIYLLEPQYNNPDNRTPQNIKNVAIKNCCYP